MSYICLHPPRSPLEKLPDSKQLVSGGRFAPHRQGWICSTQLQGPPPVAGTSEVGQRPVGRREETLLRRDVFKVPHGRRRSQPEFESVIPKLGFRRRLSEN